VKAKGRALQNLVRDKLREVFVFTSKIPKLKEDDIKSQTMGMTGEDIVLSPQGQKIIPYSFECKNVEKLSFWAAVEQAEANTKEGMHAAVVVKKNRKNPYVAISLNHFIELISKEYKVK
tara:strand:- start:2765 stop:3121 length:357 start_codon:yes stop_codon:yes gene_type:complete